MSIINFYLLSGKYFQAKFGGNDMAKLSLTYKGGKDAYMSRKLEDSFSIEVITILSGSLGSVGKATSLAETTVTLSQKL